MKILVLGPSGQIGSEIISSLSRESNSHNHYPIDLIKLTREELDLSEIENIYDALCQYKPDCIINASAYTDVDQAEEEKSKAFLINHKAIEMISRACFDLSAFLIHISTDYVFDGMKDTPYSEEDKTKPLSAYGLSKLAGELSIKKNLDKYIILRTSWVFGYHGSNFFKKMLELAQHNNQISIVADQYGAPTSSSAIADAISKMALSMNESKKDDKRWGTYHFCGERYVSWAEFAKVIFSECFEKGLIDKQPLITQINSSEFQTKARRPYNSKLDCSKIRNKFGIIPDNWETSMIDVIDRLIKEKKS